MEEDVFLEQFNGILGLSYKNQVTVDRYCSILDEAIHGTVQGAFTFKKLVTFELWLDWSKGRWIHVYFVCKRIISWSCWWQSTWRIALSVVNQVMAAGSRMNKINIWGSMNKGNLNIWVLVLVRWRQRMKLLKKQHWRFVTRMHNHYNLLLGYTCPNPGKRMVKLTPQKGIRVQEGVDSWFGDDSDTRQFKSTYLGTIGGGRVITSHLVVKRAEHCNIVQHRYRIYDIIWRSKQHNIYFYPTLWTWGN